MQKALTFNEVLRERQAADHAERLAMLRSLAKALAGEHERPAMTAHETLDTLARAAQTEAPELTREQAEASVYKRHPELIDAVEREDERARTA